MDAVLDILRAHGLKPNLKWVDDLNQLRYPISGACIRTWKYGFDIEDIFRLTEPLGVRWKLGKCFRFAFLTIYLGFLWDLIQRLVSLPEAKRIKYLAKLTDYLKKISKGRVSLQDTMSLNGTLSHITFVFPDGRAYLTNLCTFIAVQLASHHCKVSGKGFLVR